ncbi:MAG: RNA polymerase sigma factor [Mangrovicoccus sp.]
MTSNDFRDPRDELVEHLPSLRAFAMSLTRNNSRADDLVQDTILKAWSKIESFQPGTNLRAWLFTILRNTYYSDRRKASREVEDVDGVMTASLSEKPAHDGRLALRDFAVAFDQLKPEQREALILVGASGFSYEEAAEMCGVKVGTIKSRANRGRAHLAELMQLNADEALELTDQSTLSVISSGSIAAA